MGGVLALDVVVFGEMLDSAAVGAFDAVEISV